jgi:group I intron endonuclease
MENILNGDCYIGQSANLHKRKIDHFASLKRGVNDNKNLQEAYNIYGKENFEFKVILYCEPDQLTYYEQSCVDTFDPAYNICRECVFTTKGVFASEETRKLISQNHADFKGENHPNFGKHWDEEVRKNMSLAKLGKKHAPCSDEQKIKLSIALSGDKNGMFNKHHTEESKKKISDATKGVKKSEETKKRMSEAQHRKGETSEETKKRQSIAQKKRWDGKRKSDLNKEDSNE